MYFGNGRTVFLVLRQKPLLFASEMIEALHFDDLAITCRMNVFSNCIKNQFTHSFAQFAMLTSISGDENEITLGFKQRSNVRDVAVKNVHVCIGQNQRIEEIFSSRLKHFLIDKSTVFLHCGNHVYRQILISHGSRSLHLDEQIHGYKFRGKCYV